ncbi:hypothetical protein Salmuc_02069 [Salipiger mucosus DSM 16094]|uniref:Uncharacterized protein n=2 Tax=Salipiger mucosus TaxID=263378 RepID=S9QPU5_9RHOB|nr:hypothetical protein Salmuc_02069 [Salipiger mucosus DSM 16094]
MIAVVVLIPVWVPIAILMLVSGITATVADLAHRVGGVLLWPISAIERARKRQLTNAHATMSADEIRERLGEKTPRIVPNSIRLRDASEEA